MTSLHAVQFSNPRTGGVTFPQQTTAQQMSTYLPNYATAPNAQLSGPWAGVVNLPGGMYDPRQNSSRETFTVTDPASTEQMFQNMVRSRLTENDTFITRVFFRWIMDPTHSMKDLVWLESRMSSGVATQVQPYGTGTGIRISSKRNTTYFRRYGKSHSLEHEYAATPMGQEHILAAMQQIVVELYRALMLACIYQVFALEERIWRDGAQYDDLYHATSKRINMFAIMQTAPEFPMEIIMDTIEASIGDESNRPSDVVIPIGVSRYLKSARRENRVTYLKRTDEKAIMLNTDAFMDERRKYFYYEQNVIELRDGDSNEWNDIKINPMTRVSITGEWWHVSKHTFNWTNYKTDNAAIYIYDLAQDSDVLITLQDMVRNCKIFKPRAGQYTQPGGNWPGYPGGGSGGSGSGVNVDNYNMDPFSSSASFNSDAMTPFQRASLSRPINMVSIPADTTPRASSTSDYSTMVLEAGDRGDVWDRYTKYFQDLCCNKSSLAVENDAYKRMPMMRFVTRAGSNVVLPVRHIGDMSPEWLPNQHLMQMARDRINEFKRSNTTSMKDDEIAESIYANLAKSLRCLHQNNAELAKKVLGATNSIAAGSYTAKSYDIKWVSALGLSPEETDEFLAFAASDAVAASEDEIHKKLRETRSFRTMEDIVGHLHGRIGILQATNKFPEKFANDDDRTNIIQQALELLRKRRSISERTSEETLKAIAKEFVEFFVAFVEFEAKVTEDENKATMIATYFNPSAAPVQFTPRPLRMMAVSQRRLGAINEYPVDEEDIKRNSSKIRERSEALFQIVQFCPELITLAHVLVGTNAAHPLDITNPECHDLIARFITVLHMTANPAEQAALRWVLLQPFSDEGMDRLMANNVRLPTWYILGRGAQAHDTASMFTAALNTSGPEARWPAACVLGKHGIYTAHDAQTGVLTWNAHVHGAPVIYAEDKFRLLHDIMVVGTLGGHGSKFIKTTYLDAGEDRFDPADRPWEKGDLISMMIGVGETNEVEPNMIDLTGRFNPMLAPTMSIILQRRPDCFSTSRFYAALYGYRHVDFNAERERVNDSVRISTFMGLNTVCYHGRMRYYNEKGVEETLGAKGHFKKLSEPGINANDICYGNMVSRTYAKPVAIYAQ